MKKYITFLLIIFSTILSFNQLNAQLRPYIEPIADYDVGETNYIQQQAGADAIVDTFGNPINTICCENNNFDFTLNFTSFSNLIALENRIIDAQRAALDAWLHQQESTFLIEINRQMGRNYSSFNTAQREYFKFYEGGPSGNMGPVRMANELGSLNSQYSREWRERADVNIMKYDIFDNWIKCGYCFEFNDLAYDIGNLSQYDHDNSPGPEFYANIYRDGNFDSFGENLYASALNNSIVDGFKVMLEGDYLLNRISELRVNHYRSLGWQDRVFLMSAYLINANLNCPTPIFSCLPSELLEYRPPVLWSEDILKQWAKELGSEIPLMAYIFSEDYENEPISYFVNLYGPYSYGYYRTNIPQTREFVTNALLNAPEENEICSGIRWNDIGDSYYSTLKNLRLKAGVTIAGIKIGPTTTYTIPDICIQIPNFERVGNEEIKIPNHRATTRLKLAWSSAIDAVAVDLAFLNRVIAPVQ